MASPLKAAPKLLGNKGNIGKVAPRKRADKILRFLRAERLLHWAVAIPFLLCLGSGAALFIIYNPAPTRAGREIFSWVHKISGACLIGFPLLAIGAHLRDFRVYLENIREALVWSLDDIKWMILMPPSMIIKKIKVPEEGKFNAGEKVNFIQTMVAYLVMGVTGLIIWSQSNALLPWLVHLSMAVAVLPMLGVHLFMAMVNPATRVGLSGMITGYVERDWARHHYRRWYREKFEGTAADEWSDVTLKVMLPHWTHSEISTPRSLAKTARARRLLLKGALMISSPIWVCLLAFLALRFFSVTPTRMVAAAFHRLVHLSEAGIVSPPGGNPTMFLQEKLLLLSRPAEDASPLPGGPLARGSRLTLYGHFRTFALVQDIQARAGYVPSSALGPNAPVIEPGFAFPDCRSAFPESDGSACEDRARTMLQTCRSGCAGDRSQACFELCGKRFAVCVKSCKALSAELGGARRHRSHRRRK